MSNSPNLDRKEKSCDRSTEDPAGQSSGKRAAAGNVGGGGVRASAHIDLQLAQERFEALSVYLRSNGAGDDADDRCEAEDLQEGTFVVDTSAWDGFLEQRKALKRPVVIAYVKNRNARQTFNAKCSMDQLLYADLVPHASSHVKDGLGWLQGSVKNDGGPRDARNMGDMETANFDIDNGQKPEEIEAAAKGNNIECIIHPSFNDGKPETRIETDKLMQWANKQGARWSRLDAHTEANEEQALAFLTEEKGYLPWVMEDAKLRGREGHEYVVTHAPLPRFRVKVPLKDKITLTDLAPTLAGVKERWIAFYFALGHKLGILHFDESCKDLSRLFFAHRRPKGVQSWSIHVLGVPIDFYAELADLETGRDAGNGANSSNPFTDAAARNGKASYHTHWMPRFTARHWRFFNAAQYVADHGKNGLAKAEGQSEAECEFIDEHQSHDAPGSRTMYARDARESAKGIAIVGCNHHHCDYKGPRYIEAIAIRCGHTATDLMDYVDGVEQTKHNHGGERAQGDGPKRTRTIFTTADQVEERGVSWLWDGHIPLRAVTLAVGPTKVGKSQFGIHVMARTTDGKAFTCGDRGLEGRVPEREPARCVLVTAEDAINEAVIPRLKAAGADLSRVEIVEGWVEVDASGKEEQKRFSLEDSLRALSDLLDSRSDVTLVVIDPVNAYLGKTDSHRNAEVRGVLQPLKELAEKYNVAVLLVHHMKKGKKEGNVTDMSGGSNAFVEAVRSVLVLVPEPKETGRSILQVERSNYARSGQGYLYRIEDACTDKGNPTSRFVILEDEKPTMSASQALSERESDDDGSTKLDVVEFLVQILGEGEVLHGDIQKAAKGEKLSWDRVRRMRSKLGIQSNRVGFSSDGKQYWSLPAEPECGRLVASVLGVAYKAGMTAAAAIAASKGAEIFGQ